MAFNRLELSAGFGGTNTFQVFTYTSSVDDKTAINDLAYWGDLPQTLFKNGAVIYFTTKAGGDNATVMGMKTFYPYTVTAEGGSIESAIAVPPEPIVVTPPEPTSIFEPGGLGNMFGRNK